MRQPYPAGRRDRALPGQALRARPGPRPGVRGVVKSVRPRRRIRRTRRMRPGRPRIDIDRAKASSSRVSYDSRIVVDGPDAFRRVGTNKCRAHAGWMRRFDGKIVSGAWEGRQWPGFDDQTSYAAFSSGVRTGVWTKDWRTGASAAIESGSPCTRKACSIRPPVCSYHQPRSPRSAWPEKPSRT